MIPRKLRLVLEMIRFSHTVFALPFAFLSAVMAWTLGQRSAPSVPFRWRDLLGILLCMVFARSAAMAFNRLVDRDWDAKNPRTANRHLPAGLLSVSEVALFAVACGVCFVASTVLFLPNQLPLWLSLPVLGFLLTYSLTKRFTSLSHVWLGASLMLAPICAWIAIRGVTVQEHPIDLLPAWILGLAVLAWVSGFDIIYACQDTEFDREIGLRSLPARFGVTQALRMAAVCHAVTVALLWALPFAFPLLGGFYMAGVGIVTVLLFYEHWLVRPGDLSRVNQAFFQVNAVISIGLLVATAIDLWR